MIDGLVSAIIPVFNRPALLVEAVTMRSTQTYSRLEVIVVDDGSTDETPESHPIALRARLARSHRAAHKRWPGLARQSGREIGARRVHSIPRQR